MLRIDSAAICLGSMDDNPTALATGASGGLGAEVARDGVKGHARQKDHMPAGGVHQSDGRWIAARAARDCAQGRHEDEPLAAMPPQCAPMCSACRRRRIRTDDLRVMRAVLLPGVTLFTRMPLPASLHAAWRVSARVRRKLCRHSPPSWPWPRQPSKSVRPLVGRSRVRRNRVNEQAGKFSWGWQGDGRP